MVAFLPWEMDDVANGDFVAEKGQLEVVKQLVEMGFDVDRAMKNGATPTSIAAAKATLRRSSCSSTRAPTWIGMNTGEIIK